MKYHKPLLFQFEDLAVAAITWRGLNLRITFLRGKMSFSRKMRDNGATEFILHTVHK